MLPGALKQNNKLESTKKLRDVHIFSIHYTAKGCATYTGCRLMVPIFDLYVTCSLQSPVIYILKYKTGDTFGT